MPTGGEGGEPSPGATAALRTGSDRRRDAPERRAAGLNADAGHMFSSTLDDLVSDGTITSDQDRHLRGAELGHAERGSRQRAADVDGLDPELRDLT